MPANAEKITVEWDENGASLLLVFDDEPGHLSVNIHGIIDQFWSEVQGKIGPYMLEKELARRDYNAHQDTEEGPWPGETAMDYYGRTGDDEPLREQADTLVDRIQEYGRSDA